MTAVDSSVVVPAFASWHTGHAEALALLAESSEIVAHAALESYSVLTRLPAPHRAPPAVVRDYLVERFPAPWLTLTAGEQRAFLERLPELGVSGGAVYDALIAATASARDAELVTLDARALETYRRVGVRVRPGPGLGP